MRLSLFLLVCLLASSAHAQPIGLITNVPARDGQSLNGPWKTIIDPYENGYYDYRYQPVEDGGGYTTNRKPSGPGDLVEFNYDASEALFVPGDWNTQRDELLFYEGTIWYQNVFQAQPSPERRLFIHFGAANYEARVYVNGKSAGSHTGGFTPFEFEITDAVTPGENVVIVKVDNKRHREGIPTVNSDWWNYGGITRDVRLLDLPQTFIRDYLVQLAPGSGDRIRGWVQLDGARAEQSVRVRLREAGIETTVRTDADGYAALDLPAPPNRWSPEDPMRYRVEIDAETDRVEEWIGFRTVETRGSDILVNGEPVFLRGVSIHEEAPFRSGRAWSEEDARTLLGWAKDLGCNFVRLAHYPHNENMTRLADEMGLLVWSEIPVYWTILWENEPTAALARRQLTEMITRDRNRASIILWSVANETPVGEPRLRFLTNLIELARTLDDTRLITAALERHYIDDTTQMIDDPLGAYLDVVGVNEYVGWYDGPPEKADKLSWKMIYDKPLIFSEFGGGALQGLHGSPDARWTEEYQRSIYEHQVAMFDRIPFLRGTSPWILMDFRSPRRPLADIQDFWNRKGLVSDHGERKAAFYVLQDWYAKKEAEAK